MEQTISNRHLTALCLVAMLSPFLRLLPGSIAAQSGSAAWVSAALAAIPAGLLWWGIVGLLKYYPKGTGLGQIILNSLGAFPGSVVLCLWSLWLMVHSGFILRSGADRFIATIYPGSRPFLFVVVTAVLCVIAAIGPIKTLCRTSQIFRPLLLGVIGLVLVFTIPEAEPVFLLPVTDSQTRDILMGVPLAAEPVSIVLVNGAFLIKHLDPRQEPMKRWPKLLGVVALGVLMCAISVGSLGKTVTAALPYPFFVMARDLSIVSGVERIEALVVALWLLPDFVLVAMELMIAADNLLLVFGKPEGNKVRTGIIIGSAIVAGVLAFRFVPADGSLLVWSDRIIPTMQLIWAYGMVPLVLLVCTIRKKF